MYGICVCFSLLKRKPPRAKLLDLDRVEAIITTTTMMMTKTEQNTEREREKKIWKKNKYDFQIHVDATKLILLMVNSIFFLHAFLFRIQSYLCVCGLIACYTSILLYWIREFNLKVISQLNSTQWKILFWDWLSHNQQKFYVHGANENVFLLYTKCNNNVHVHVHVSFTISVRNPFFFLLQLSYSINESVILYAGNY